MRIEEAEAYCLTNSHSMRPGGMWIWRRQCSLCLLLRFGAEPRAL